MSQEPEKASNSDDAKKADKIFTAVTYGTGAGILGMFGAAMSMMYNQAEEELRAVEQKIGTPAQPEELTKEALKQTFINEAVQQAFANNEPLVIDLTDPVQRQPLEAAVEKTRDAEKKRVETSKTMHSFWMASTGAAIVSVAGWHVYQRRRKQQANSSPPPPGND
ncbi:MAG: hypothetical protein IT559_06575 [Alphaproteobacteria bacterium]|nr:hypothetical protein [Alphaproteobacteria bacterium]